MPSSNASLLELEDETESFEVAAQVAILRRAIAEIVIPRGAAGARLSRLAGDLAVHCVLAQATVSSSAFMDLARYDTSLEAARSDAEAALTVLASRFERIPDRKPTASLLELLRRKLHRALTDLGHVLAARHEPAATATELERALALRQAVSDFQEAVLPAQRARANLPWALLVAEAELVILMEHSAVAHGPEAERDELAALRARLLACRRRTDANTASKLYPELVRPKVLGRISRRHDVKRHDERRLLELSSLLSRRFPDDALAAVAVDSLVWLRGMDQELDNLIVELPFDAPRVLVRIAKRVDELRACALAS